MALTSSLAKHIKIPNSKKKKTKADQSNLYIVQPRDDILQPLHLFFFSSKERANVSMSELPNVPTSLDSYALGKRQRERQRDRETENLAREL